METLAYLLEKYKQGTATDNEKQSLLEALSVNELQLMALMEKEFNSHVDNPVLQISPERSMDIFRQIQQRTTLSGTEPKQAKVFRMSGAKWKWLAAACVAGIVVIGALYLQQRPASVKPVLATETQRQLKTISNAFAERMTTTLQDGSVVTLEPGSAISFYQPYDSAKRDISLRGKALFKVAKDTSKPFTVYANGIATTALGTEFWVDARFDSISVKLLEGKVVVRSVNKEAMHDVYLKPGEQFTLNRQTGVWAVTDFNTRAGNAIPVKKRDVNPVTLSFNKTPLAEVFDKIGKRYHIDIKYNSADLQTLSFTGNFLMNDSLQTILTIICNTNDLSFEQGQGVVVINK